MLCKLRIRDLEGEANITLCRLRMFIPVLNVPYDATIIALSEVSVSCLISSRSSVSTPPCTRYTGWSVSLFMRLNKGIP